MHPQPLWLRGCESPRENYLHGNGAWLALSPCQVSLGGAMSMIENDPAILGLKSRCTTLKTNGNQLEERFKGLQTPLNEQVPPPAVNEFTDVSTGPFPKSWGGGAGIIIFIIFIFCRGSQIL